MEKTVRFLRNRHALNVDWFGLFKAVMIIIGVSSAPYLKASTSTFVGIPEIVFPADLDWPCLGDTMPASTGEPYCMMHCDCDLDITYNDVVIPGICDAEYTIERTWNVTDSCGLDTSSVQTINLVCTDGIGISKQVVNIDPGSSGVRGNFNATFEVTFENTGNVKLTDLELEDLIQPGYGSAYVGIVAGGEPRITYSSADLDPTIDMSFDGQVNIDIFDIDSSCLDAGQKIVVQYTIEVNPNALGRPDTAYNQAYGFGIDPCGDVADDLSDTGSDTRGTNPGVLGDRGTSDDPTVLPLLCVGAGAKAMACNTHTNISLDKDCSLDIPASVIVEGEDWGCDVFYEVMITDHHGRPIPSPIPGSYKGETLHVKVVDAVFGNSCWGTVLIEDKFAPTIECENDTIYCNALENYPDPVFYDNCDPNPVLQMVKHEAFPLSCDSLFTKRIVRHWQAYDEYGNRSLVCQQTIMLKRIPLDSIKYPQDYTIGNNWALKCNGSYPTDTAGHPSPEYTGAPSIGGLPIYPFFQYCNVSADYEDRIIQHGPCVKKVMRLWRIVEWRCGSAEIVEVPQLIHIVDDEPPIIVCPTVDYVTTNGGYTCEADVDLPYPEVHDSCTAVTIDLHYPGGVIHDFKGGRVTLPYGIHDVVYVARDECYNESRCTTKVEVFDHTPPVTVCDGFTTVGLNEYGEAHLYAIALDDGTYDDCYLDSFAVRRMDMGRACGNQDTLFRSFITFCCDDVDSSNVMVVFRAWDKAGNYNDCMVEVEVQDKVPPSVYCPPNITVSCDFHFDMDSLDHYFGTIVQDYHDRQPIVLDDPHAYADGPLYDGHVLENCDVDIQESRVDSLSQCRTGYILRGFTITDRQGLQSQCYQRITIKDFYPFDSTDIVWPLNYETTDCGTDFHPDNLPELYGRPKVNDDKCSLVGMEWEDHVFSFIQDSLVCYKVLRKWKVIDWCNFKMVDNNYVYEKWEYEQIIKVNNIVGPEFTQDCDSNIVVCTYDPDCLDGRVELTMTASDDCTPDADLKWSYRIDAFRDGIIDDEQSGTGNFADATDDYPIGKHFIIWAFEDQCGNKSVCRQSFEVVNCKAPTAFCKNGIIVDLLPIDTNSDGTVDLGRVEIWASDLNDNSYQGCNNPVTVSFSSDTFDLFRRYDCDSLGMRTVRVYVTDRITGNQDFCVTFVEVQDNNDVCPDTTGMISGILKTSEGLMIHDVNVEVSGTVSQQGTFSGAYNFSDLPFSGNYIVRPSKMDGPMNGITTRDIVMIQRHLLGLEQFDSPYKLIAGDANGDRDMSIADVVEIRRLLLGYYAEFPNMNSWRFIDDSYQFVDPMDPLNENFNESYDIYDMPGNMFSVDFTGVKVGDVDESADPFSDGGISTRSDDIEIWNTQVEGRDLIFRSSEDLTLTGAQFTLNFDPRHAEFESVIGGVLQIDDRHLGLSNVNEGILLASFDSDQVLEVKAGDELFRLSFSAPLNSENVQMVNYPLVSEMYDADLSISSLVLSSMKSESQGMFTVLQNVPNPFADKTMINVEVMQPITVDFKVYDMTGRTFIQRTIELHRGVNLIEVEKSDLSKGGVYYYQVSGGAGMMSKKMILME